jgi:hypothetical protein
VTELPLTAIRLEDGTQVRAAIDDAVVSDYAIMMADGAVFPPIAVFLHDDAYYLADGYHRVRAAQRIQRSTIAAEVHPGTREDALWFALGANRTNGQRLTDVDKTHAVKLALAAWPTRTNREIADQVGCSSSLVSKVIQDVATNTGGKPGIRGRALLSQQKLEAVREMVLAGEQSIVIEKKLRAHGVMIANVRRELGLNKIDFSRPALNARRVRMRELASEGHTSHQIAAELGLSLPGCRRILRHLSISVPADLVTHHTRRPESNRIMARIVADAEDLAAGANLIDFSALDPRLINDWIATLRRARTTLGKFIKQLTQETLHHGEAAEPNTVQDSPRPDLVDSHADCVGDPARIS